VRLRRDAFDGILARAVPSSFDRGVYADLEAWQRAVAGSSVRLQWDPDHGPAGEPLARRAIQLGLRGDALAGYAREWLLGIEDISKFVEQQRVRAEKRDYAGLVTPREDVYPVADVGIAAKLGVSSVATFDVEDGR
jgi:hypothetical protein